MSFQITDLCGESELIQKNAGFASEVIEGLSKENKRLPSWLIFDDQGSEIFQKITELEDYHPAVCEMEIFHKLRFFKSFKWVNSHSRIR